MKNLFRWPARRTASARSSRRASLGLESLESRTLMSVSAFGTSGLDGGWHSSIPVAVLPSVSGVKGSLQTPANLRAALITATTVKLTWTQNDSVTQGFNILRSVNGGDFVLVATIDTAGGTTFTDSGLDSATQYKYQVQAFTDTARKTSGSVSATTKLLTPTNFAATALSSTSVKLTWANADPDATGYVIYRSVNGSSFSQLVKISSGATGSYTDSTVTAGQYYAYQIKATSSLVSSVVSAPITPSSPFDLAPPTNLTLNVQNNNDVTLNWVSSDNNATGFVILRSVNGGAFSQLTTVSAPVSADAGRASLYAAMIHAMFDRYVVGSPTPVSFTDTTTVAGNTYTYAVKAVSTSSTSAASDPASITLSLSLAAPTNLGLTVLSSSSIKLAWTNGDANAAGAIVFRSTDGVNFTQIAKIASLTTYTDTGLAAFTNYTYRVESYAGSYTSADSDAATAKTLHTTPSNLVATSGSSTISLTWTSNDSTLTGFYVDRSTDGVNYTTIATTGAVKNYTDSAVTVGTTYYYRVRGFGGGSTTGASNVATSAATLNLAAPTGLALTVQSSTSIKLAWSNGDANAAGYIVYRSTDGGSYVQVAKFTSATTYTDAALSPFHNYSYYVRSYNGTFTSGSSNIASATTPLATPSSLTVTATSSSATLSWSNSDTSPTGYYIYRSTNGSTFTQIGTTTAKTYSDSTVAAGTTYYYQVKSYNGTSTSAASNTASVAVPTVAPPSTSGSVAITTRYSNELVLTASSTGTNSIYVTQSGTTLTIVADGVTSNVSVPAAGLFIYSRGGTDTITLDSSVTLRVTIASIDGASTTISSAAANVSAWIDSTDSYSGTGTQHKVASYYGGVAKTTGASLAEPTDAGTTTKVNLSLFGTGPAAGDVNQGSVGDCYFLSALAGFAGQKPGTLLESAVDMGDGTYVVQYVRSGVTNYLRVSNNFSSGYYSGGLKYAHPGSNNTMWAAVFEKAWTYFRSGANTYASIASGWMSECYAVFGKTYTASYPGSSTEASLYTAISTALAAGKVVTFGTISSPPNLVGNHAYTVIAVYKDASTGATTYLIRNPWGTSGRSIENSQGYATLTYAQMVANFMQGAISAA